MLADPFLSTSLGCCFTGRKIDLNTLSLIILSNSLVVFFSQYFKVEEIEVQRLLVIYRSSKSWYMMEKTFKHRIA